VTRSQLIVLLLVLSLATGGWLVRGCAALSATPRAEVPRGDVEREAVIQTVLADPGRVPDESPETSADRIESVRVVPSGRTTAASIPGPAGIVGRLHVPFGERLPDGVALDDVQLDWRVPSSRRIEQLEELDGRTVEIETWDGDRHITFADADGSFEYTNAQVGVALELELTGHGPAQVVALPPLDPGEHRRLDVVLDLGVTIAGWVRDEKGRALPGVDVYLEDPSVLAEHEEHSTLPRTEADERGRFEFSHVARRAWSAFLWNYRFESGVRPVIDASHGPVHDVELVAWRGNVIEGTVSWSDGTPVEAFWIDFHGRAGRREWSAGGRFRVEELEGSEYMLELRAVEGSGSLVLPRVPTDGEPLAIVLDRAPLGAVRVLVQDDLGEPLPGATIEAKYWGLSAFHGETDERGRCELQLPAGDWLISAASEGYSENHGTWVVGEPELEVRLVLARECTVGGTVVDPRGLRLAGATVEEFSNEVVTDAEGRFSLVPTGPQFWLLARADGYAESEEYLVDGRPGVAVDGIVLRLRESCDLAGRVLDPAGRPVEGCTAVFRAGAHHAISDWTDERGEFTLAGLPCGELELIVREDDTGCRLTIPLRLPRTAPVEVRLPALDPVRVRGRLTRGGEATTGSVSLYSERFAVGTATAPDGSFDLEVPLPGPCILLASPRGKGSELHRTELTIPDADAHVLDVELDDLAVAPSWEEEDVFTW
jgi:hypothetical protein